MPAPTVGDKQQQWESWIDSRRTPLQVGQRGNSWPELDFI